MNTLPLTLPAYTKGVMAALSDAQRLLVMMHYFNNMPLSEIAQSCDISTEQLRRLLRSANAAITRQMLDFELENPAFLCIHPLTLFILSLKCGGA